MRLFGFLYDYQLSDRVAINAVFEPQPSYCWCWSGC